MADDKVKTVKIDLDTKDAVKRWAELTKLAEKYWSTASGNEKSKAQAGVVKELSLFGVGKFEAESLLRNQKVFNEFSKKSVKDLTEKVRLTETLVNLNDRLYKIEEKRKKLEAAERKEWLKHATLPNVFSQKSGFTPKAVREQLEKIKAEQDEIKRIKKLEASGTRGLGTLLADQTYGSNIYKRGLRWWKSEEGPKSFMADTRNRFATSVSWKLANLPLNTLDTAWKKIKDGVKISARYEDALAKTQAIAGSTAGTLRDLANAVYEVGSNSRYTNDELIETTTILAQAGYSAKEIETLLGTVSRLASATGTDAKTSVDLLTSSMSLWNAQTSDAAQMADVLTVAVNKTKAEINSIQRGLQYAGAAASQMGMSFEETVAAMSAVTNAGLKTRSIMGTGLRALLTELSNPAKKFQTELAHVGLTMDDVNVRTLGLSKVMDNLQKAGFGAENAFRGLDRQAASFYLALKSQSDLFNRLPEDMKARGAAAEAEAKRMDTLLAQWTRLKNVGAEFSAALGFLPRKALKEAAEFLSDFLEGVNKSLRHLSDLLDPSKRKLDYKFEKANSELDSAKQKTSSLADEMERINRDSKIQSGDVNAIKDAHASLAEKFDSTGKSARKLSTNLKELIEYEKELLKISLGEQEESQRKKLEIVEKQIAEFNTNKQTGEISLANQRYLLDKLGYSNKRTLKDRYIKNFALLPTEKLRDVINEYFVDRPEKIENDDTLNQLRVFYSLLRERDAANASLKKIEESRQPEAVNVVGSATKFFNTMGGENLTAWKKGLSSKTRVEQTKSYVSAIDEARKMWRSVEDLEGNEDSKRTIGETASTYIQSLVSGLSETLIKLSEETDKNLKNASVEGKQKIKKDYTKTVDGLIDTLSGDKGVLSAVLSLIENEKGIPDELKEKLRYTIEKNEGQMIDLLRKRFETQVREVSAKINRPETEHDRKMQKLESAIKEVGMSPEEINARRVGEAYKNQGDFEIKIIPAAEQAIEDMKAQRDTTYSRMSDAEFQLGIKRNEDDLKKLKEEAKQYELDKVKGEFETKKLNLDYALALSARNQSLLASETSLKIAQMKDSRYGLSKRWNALDSITAATMNREVLESERRRIKNDYKTRTESPYFASLSETEKMNAQTEYENALRQNEEALLQNTQALREATEQRERETEGTEGFARGAKDFFESIPTESASYAMTLEALNSTSNGLKTAFKDIAVNGMKASDAFKQMAQSILQSLANKAIDKGVDYMMSAIGAAFNLGTPALMGSFGTSGATSGGSVTSSSKFYASGSGPVATLPKNSTVLSSIGVSTGGFVSYNGIKKFATGGTAGKDSVPALLMPGEYVMKKSAVDMIGKDTLDAMNNAATRMHKEDRSSGRVREKSSKPVVTNVYVVSDPKEAGMTPNDVVVAIGRDILQGGQTRQLIQQVVQGQY